VIPSPGEKQRQRAPAQPFCFPWIPASAGMTEKTPSCVPSSKSATIQTDLVRVVGATNHVPVEADQGTGAAPGIKLAPAHANFGKGPGRHPGEQAFGRRAESGLDIGPAEVASQRVELFRLFHVAYVSGVGDDGQLSVGDGVPKLLRYVHRAASIVISPHQ